MNIGYSMVLSAHGIEGCKTNTVPITMQSVAMGWRFVMPMINDIALIHLHYDSEFE